MYLTGKKGTISLGKVPELALFKMAAKITITVNHIFCIIFTLNHARNILLVPKLVFFDQRIHMF